MRALVVEHDPLSTPERVGAHLERRGYTLDHFVVVEDVENPGIEARFPENGSHDLIVLMGAPWSVYDPIMAGWVSPEIDFIREQHQRRVPILGICFGGQILSAALGGEVRRAMQPEYGWTTIDSTAEEIADGPWFEHHHDELTLPPGAVELARSPSGVQAFRTGRALGLQFHPEMSDTLLASWCDIDGGEEMAAAGLEVDAVIEESRIQAVRTQQALERMLDWFLHEIAGGP